MAYDPTKDPNHVHRYSVYTVKSAFESRPDGAYDMVDYGYLYCQCTHMVKVPVHQDNEFDVEAFLQNRNS